MGRTKLSMHILQGTDNELKILIFKLNGCYFNYLWVSIIKATFKVLRLD